MSDTEVKPCIDVDFVNKTAQSVTFIERHGGDDEYMRLARIEDDKWDNAIEALKDYCEAMAARIAREKEIGE